MTMDLIILAIFLVTVFICWKLGFARTLVGFLKGIASVVIAWILSKPLANFLSAKTAIKTNMANGISKYFSTKLSDSNLYDSLPDLFKGENGILNLDKLNNSIGETSQAIAGLLITLICFFAIWIVLRIVLAVVASGFKNANKDGAVSKTDHKMGILLGIVLGLALIYAFLALIVPVVTLILPNQLDNVMGWFDGAIVSKWLYDNNLLLMLIQVLLK